MKEIFNLYCDEFCDNCTKIIVEIDPEYDYFINFIIETDGFKGHGPIYLFENDVPVYIDKIESMYQTLKGKCRIQDTESEDSFVEFEFKERKLFFTGLISNYFQKLIFECEVDQTILNSLLLVLKKINNNKE